MSATRRHDAAPLAALAALADRLERDAPPVADRSVARMYEEDPFWLERFGARGRRYADEDGRFHLTYLVESLRLGAPDTLVEYARWLRTLLVTRGMCTRHLEENLLRLAAMLEEEIEDAAPAGAFLREAAAGLAYADEPARTVQQEGDRLADAAVAALGVLAHGASPVREARHLASCLADAVASGSADMLARHVEWLDRSLETHVPSVPRLGERLYDALGSALALLPAGAREAAEARLREARAPA